MNPLDWGELENKPRLSSVFICGTEVNEGDRVRLCPKKGGNIFDLALADRIAVVESIEQDYDEKVHPAVGLDGGLRRADALDCKVWT
jgi:hypothetical protein